MPLDIRDLEADLEGRFWEVINQDPLNYYFFILDWKLQRDFTKILLALDQDEIVGMMLIYKNSIVSLRGRRDSVEKLLDHLELQKVELVAPKDFQDIVLRKYKSTQKYELLLMYMERGKEKISKKYEPITLSKESAGEIASLMKNAFPEWWDDVNPDKIANSMDDTYWIGIKEGDRLVSIGNTRFVDIGSNIGVIGTDEAYRNRGMATSIVSTLVEEIFKRHSLALIHVLRSNPTAVHVYSKIGFKIHKSFFLIKNGERIQSP